MFRLPLARAFMRSPILPKLFPSPPACRILPSSPLTTGLRSPLSPRPSAGRPFSSSTYQSYRQRPRYQRFPTATGTFSRTISPKSLVVFAGVAVGCYVGNLETVELTGRRRFNCVSRRQEIEMGNATYQEILLQEGSKIYPENHRITVLVDYILQRLLKTQPPLEGAQWKVHVIHDPSQINAFVLPNGKVFVYSGMLKVCKDEDQLAAVLGHEVAHVLAHHPAERLSSHNLLGILTFAIGIFSGLPIDFTRFLSHLLIGLPHSRTQEAEADDIGLIMMAKACFKPEAAIDMWTRMQELDGGGGPPQLLSTHPTHLNRIEALSARQQEAEVVFENNGCHAMEHSMGQFRQTGAFSNPFKSTSRID